ncbi:DUF4089 domain-containing protein [Calothrix sp. 336/3]|uniref:DUF4089 domain-containing protein n=1 Tax=Calothrix sp. 336/3 TaxID=1337936 RepID=UPI0004E30219|nr:DUF4089 domain-containing protein [Calothrix sp. 336/3]AKG22375.1 hypothetical protein IJ00_14855 [Calothrix sp. 336/3]
MEKQTGDIGKYVEQMALLMDLNLPEEYQESVITNFRRIQEFAEMVNEFQLTEEVEPVNIFEP